MNLVVLWLLVIFQVRAEVIHNTSEGVLNNSVSMEAVVYEVGPEKDFTSLHQVPWGELMPGDKVLIYWREEPYKEKFALSRMGTKEAPIVVSGVPGPEGQLPVIDGNGATIVSKYSFTNDNRCVIKVGSARFAGNQEMGNVGNLIIENLRIQSAHENYTYFDRGTEKRYLKNASSIYVEYADNIIIRNNILTDCGNGLFTAKGSKNVLVEGNYLYNNGVPNSIYEHGVYMSGDGLTFQFNYFGPLKQESQTIGNNIKTRGSKEVIRYNFIEGGNRALDLVDESSFSDNPEYHETHVYGNIIVDTGQGTNSSIVHYGGDSGNTETYRRGTLFFYNNTVINQRQQSQNQYIFQLETIDQKLDAWNNIFHFTSRNAYLRSGGSQNGVFRLINNWLVSHWRIGIDAAESAKTDITLENNIVGQSPLFADMANMDFKLMAESACINSGTPISPKVLPTNSLDYQYVVHLSGEERPVDDAVDIGAFEYVNDASGAIIHDKIDKGFILYPNPTNDIVVLKADRIDNFFYSYQLLDINGKSIMGGKIENKETAINLNNLYPAVYFIKIYSNESENNRKNIQDGRYSSGASGNQSFKLEQTLRVVKR